MNDITQIFESQIRNAKDLDTVIAFLSMMPHLPKYRYYHIQYIYCRGNLNEHFLKSCEKSRNLALLNKNIGAYRFNLLKNGSPISVFFFIEKARTENIFSIQSITSPNIWNLFVNKVIKAQYPYLVRPYWKQKELKNALYILEGKLSNSYDLVVKELSIKEKREDKNEKKYFPKYDYDSDRKWTSKSLKHVFDEADERGQWFRKVKLQFFAKDDEMRIEPLANCIITKYGHIFFDNMYQILTSDLLNELEHYIEIKIKLFQNKGLKERNYFPAKPLTINYDIDIFKDKSNLESFSFAIKKYPNSTKAIFHRNPYFHASVADYKDGSSFDIWILSLNRVLIIPQIRTSVEALERLISYIFDSFEEGVIREYYRNE